MESAHVNRVRPERTEMSVLAPCSRPRFLGLPSELATSLAIQISRG